MTTSEAERLYAEWAAANNLATPWSGINEAWRNEWRDFARSIAACPAQLDYAHLADCELCATRIP
jgi:hypothetical protein